MGYGPREGAPAREGLSTAQSPEAAGQGREREGAAGCREAGDAGKGEGKKEGKPAGGAAAEGGESEGEGPDRR